MTYKACLIIGGTGGIGQAMVRQLSTDNNNLVFATYHRSIPDNKIGDAVSNVHWIPMNIIDEVSIKQGVALIKAQSLHLDWVINGVGLLHTDTAQPEKAVRQVETDFFVQNMQVNALASMLIAKHIKPLLAQSTRSEQTPAIFATISARVGSIGDNALGGWYSYRMSKAALNMGMKNLSIEWGRSLKDVCVVVMQPGTVDTQLSAPFQSNVDAGALFTPAYSAECLLDVLGDMTATQTGSFVDWAGESIPW